LCLFILVCVYLFIYIFTSSRAACACAWAAFKTEPTWDLRVSIWVWILLNAARFAAKSSTAAWYWELD